jgi:exodeoxyribonuclease V gamma subunit
VLHIHRSERADGLVAMLGEVLADPLDDPMDGEIVSVPTRGVERWLTQQLSARLGVSSGRHDGVCANIDFPFPGSVVWGALAAASGVDPETDPWSPERLVWPLLEVVDFHRDDSWLSPLATHLQRAAPNGSSFGAVRHIADLYDSYGVHRPEMVRAWASGTPRREDAGWQAALWRRLRDRVGTPSPAERLDQACYRLRRERDLLDYPSRVSLFGLTRLPVSYLDVLDAMGETRDVHLFLLHPSPALWERVAATPASPARSRARSGDTTAREVRNPLLASWGRDAREMQLVLRDGVTGRAEHHLGVADGASSLLARLQSDIRSDRRPPGIPATGGTDTRSLLDPTDTSVTVHACHGRARQVEVARDAILHMLADDATLEARDVIVMCPDIEAFAPLIQATFSGSGAEDDSSATTPELPTRLADRSLRQTNPVLGAVAQMLDLAGARVTATQVLDFASREPVRRRFRLDQEDLTRLQEWIEGSYIRWGFDSDHRAAFHLGRVESNTWRAGLDRVLLGTAMAEEGHHLFGGVLPLDDVDSGDIDLAGRFAELIDRLRSALDVLSGTRTVTGWVESLAEVADALTATTERDPWQRSQLQRLLDEVLAEASTDGEAKRVLLGPGDIRSVLADRLRGQPTRANFRTGQVTVCTLVPMRSVPHRVVCLLGLDDGTFPRQLAHDGDDLIATDPHIGDRDARSEDRQLLLDALLAATEKLLITYTGRDERSNLVRPPAVPVGELLDVIDRTVRVESAVSARRQVVVDHPLHPFDVRNFTPGALIARAPWSFDRVNLDAALVSLRPREDPPPFLSRPLPDPGIRSVEVGQLERFARHPARAFLRTRLGISTFERSSDLDDALPIALDALQQWEVAERILASRMDGASLEDCLTAERARGALPPGALADQALDEITPTVEILVSAAGDHGSPRSFDVDVTLAAGTQVVGTVSGVRGDVLLQVTYSRLGPAHRLIAWTRLLALCAAWPDRPFEALTIGRARSASRRLKTTSSRIGPLARDAAERSAVAKAGLGVLADLFRRNMCEPLPLYCRTSAAWAEAALTGGSPERSATLAWTSDYSWSREDCEPEHQMVLGAVLSFEGLVARAGETSGDEESWGHPGEGRFGSYALRLWHDLLAHEEIVDA